MDLDQLESGKYQDGGYMTVGATSETDVDDASPAANSSEKTPLFNHQAKRGTVCGLKDVISRLCR